MTATTRSDTVFTDLAGKGRPQRVGDCRPRRTKHVWVKIESGPYRDCSKCVLCGGVTATPADDADCRVYLPLSQAERDLCPPLSPPGERDPHAPV